MRARARIVAQADAHGRTRLVVLQGEPPLLPRRTGTRLTTGPAEVHLVGGAAGPLGGDELRLDIEVGPGAWLVVRTVAATVALPGREDGWSTSQVRATVDTGGRLEWLPEPVVAAQNCRHVGESTVDIEVGGHLVWREEVVCGRAGEDCGNLRLVTGVNHGESPLWYQELAIGPDAPTWTGPAVLGGTRTTGSVLVVDPAWALPGQPPAAEAATTVLGTGAVHVACMPLAGPAMLTSAVAPDAHELRKALDRSTHRSTTFSADNRSAGRGS